MYLMLSLVTPQNLLATCFPTILDCSKLAAHKATLTNMGGAFLPQGRRF